MSENNRTRSIKVPFETQGYVSKQYGDARIDCYVTEPDAGVTESTGLLLLVHGWGNDGSKAYEYEAERFADGYDLVVVRVEYRDCGREAHRPEAPRTFDRPYDFSKMQTIDSLRAAFSILKRYPQIDRKRLLLWGGSQGAHIAAQCLIFAPTVWSAAVLCCGLYIPLTYERQVARGFAWDVRNHPGMGFVEYALGPGKTFDHEHEFDIRDSVRNAHLLPDSVPIAIIHGTVDDNVDIRHAVEFHARLRALRKESTFIPIPNGDHGLGGAELSDEDSRLKATLKHATHVLHHRKTLDGFWPEHVTIPVTGGRYQVRLSQDGPTLDFEAETR